MELKTLRESARALPLEERKRRRAAAERASDHDLLATVVAAGVGSGEWRSSSDCAARCFAIDDRTFRRWLEDDNLVLKDPVREKLRALAWAFGLDLSHPQHR